MRVPCSNGWDSRIPEPEAMFDPEENAAYDRLARRWLAKVIYPVMVRALPKLLPGARVLDACTGPGRLALALAKALPGVEIVGVDLSAQMLELARHNAGSGDLAERLTFERQDVGALGFDDDSFDAAITYGALHHWSDPARVFAELARVVRPGGRIVVGDWRRDPTPLAFFRSLSGTLEGRLTEASARAAYLEPEVEALLAPLSPLAQWQVQRHAMGLLIRGEVRPT